MPYFPERPPRHRAIMPPRARMMPPPGRMRYHQEIPLSNKLMSMLQSPEGQLDLEKISKTIEQMNQLYGQVSPLFSNLRKLIHR